MRSRDHQRTQALSFDLERSVITTAPRIAAAAKQQVQVHFRKRPAASHRVFVQTKTLRAPEIGNYICFEERLQINQVVTRRAGERARTGPMSGRAWRVALLVLCLLQSKARAQFPGGGGGGGAETVRGGMGQTYRYNISHTSLWR
jgi:hypothetical protein